MVLFFVGVGRMGSPIGQNETSAIDNLLKESNIEETERFLLTNGYYIQDYAVRA